MRGPLVIFRTLALPKARIAACASGRPALSASTAPGPSSRHRRQSAGRGIPTARRAGAAHASSLTGVDYAGAFLDENRAFAELFDGADESTPVPTCPEWTLRQLFRHVGRGDRWAAQIVRDRLESYLDPAPWRAASRRPTPPTLSRGSTAAPSGWWTPSS